MSATVKNTVIGLMLLGIVIIVPNAVKYANINTYEVTIVDKEVKKEDGKSKFLIFTELEDGTGRVFENTDAIFRGKFDSSDMYGEIKVGKTYEVETIGHRMPILSIYENIVEIELID